MSLLAAPSGLGLAGKASTEPQSGLLHNRLSLTNLEDLKRRILRVIAHCNKPKVTRGGPERGPAGVRASPPGCLWLERTFLNSEPHSAGH